MKKIINRVWDWAHTDMGDALMSGVLLAGSMGVIIWLSWVV